MVKKKKQFLPEISGALSLADWGFLGWGQAQPHNCTSIRGPKQITQI